VKKLATAAPVTTFVNGIVNAGQTDEAGDLRTSASAWPP